MKKLLKLSNNFNVEATQYASQANAVLGIRDSGKTYTAMKIAEQLMDNGVPIVVFDPVGVWRNIRYGVKAHKGYPIIIAGGDSASDIQLTPDNAAAIMKAAMKAGASIIFDLFSPSLSNKSKWIRIVQEIADVLMYENASSGLRHVFLEEAAEFIPQRIMPQQAKVYMSIERLARMGRNSSIGLTLINQRAEEVNKAVLELCAFIFLHKQVGKNSLLSIQKWLELQNSGESQKTVIREMTSLKQGECFVVGSSMEHTRKIKILPKNTFHPSPEKELKHTLKSTPTPITGLTALIKKIKAELNIPTEEKTTTKKQNSKGISKLLPDYDPKELNQLKSNYNKTIEELKRVSAENDMLRGTVRDMQEKVNAAITGLKDTFSKKITGPVKIKIPDNDYTGDTKYSVRVKHDHISAVLHDRVVETPSGYPAKLRMLKAIATYREQGVAKERIGLMAGVSHTSGTFRIYLNQLISGGLVHKFNNKFSITSSGAVRAEELGSLPDNKTEILIQWYRIIGEGNGQTRILRAIAESGLTELTPEQVGRASDTSHTSGTFRIYSNKLQKLGLIEKKGGLFRLSPFM